MTRQELETIVAEHGLGIDEICQGAGKFVDVFIGTGADISKLVALRASLGNARIATTLDRVTNRGHAQYGQHMLEIRSFWWE